jgi:tripartite-type tricarboxylate transporter receptor subunit TctC
MRNRLQMVSVCVMSVMGLVLATDPTPVKGQEATYPSKPIEVVVPNSQGGSCDTATRIYGDFLSRALKVPVVVTAKPGGGGLIASNSFVHNAKPDGYTLLAAPGDALIPTVQLAKTPPFDPRKDLLPVGYIGDIVTGMWVLEKSPYKTFNDFIQFAKGNPGKLVGGYTAPGGALHIMFNAIIADTNIQVTSVPYVEGGTLRAAFLGGHVDWTTQTIAGGKPFLESHDWRLLLLTSKVPAYPDIPVGPQVGLPNFSVSVWFGFFVLPQTPKPVYNKIVAAMKAAAEDPETVKKLEKFGMNCSYKSPADISKLINNEWEVYAQVIKKTGVKVD